MKRMAAWITLVALATGCASNSASMGSKPLVAIDPAAVEGTWALTDERNQTFNVILREDGSATSTWSRGMDGAKGEQGGWSIRDGVLFVRWTDGWLDTIRVGRFGFEKFSYEPSDRDSDTPSSFGQAVKINDDSAKWVGVWRTQSVGTVTKDEDLFVCLSSDGAAVKSIDAINSGCWQQQPMGLAIHWSDGWFTLLTQDGEIVTGKSWAPGVDRAGAPTGTSNWLEVVE
ncbi:MAG: hypothetical protein FJ292_00090 [Planctomycetes bacterium]|nr:hypothetical protein [Planctomycetota bacterium]